MTARSQGQGAPTHDWRGTPMTVGSIVVCASSQSSGGAKLIEGRVIDLGEKGTGSSCRPWQYVQIEILETSKSEYGNRKKATFKNMNTITVVPFRGTDIEAMTDEVVEKAIASWEDLMADD